MIFYLYYLLLCSWIKIWNEIWIRVSIRKTFAQFLRNETQNFFFLCASVLREKTTICAIIRKIHFAQNCLIPLLRNSSFAQFRNFVKSNGWWRCVFLRIQFWKNLVLECLPIDHFYIIDQWQLRRILISQFSRQF